MMRSSCLGKNVADFMRQGNDRGIIGVVLGGIERRRAPYTQIAHGHTIVIA